MKAIDKKNKKASNKSQPSLLEVLDIPMISKIKEEENYRKVQEAAIEERKRKVSRQKR